MGVELEIGGQQVNCNEVIQCQLLKTEEKFKEDAYDEERAKAMNKNSGVFLLRSLLAPPDINVAPYEVLRLVEGFGDVTARNIVNERKKRKFSIVDDAVDRVCPSKKSKTADVIRLMYSRTSADVEAYMQVQ
ncbi:hypothetical protein V7S43_000250 [Phytophthora oleae]|uniref:DisA/LigA helix-hairpin-helix motif domain-containing protein n=1 Tax=Phytophthora oleae TaxID=2107226 RepID=A0ABD3G567_9STRA